MFKVPRWLRGRRAPVAADACDPASEITFDIHVIGYANNSHGATCCMCGARLPAIEYEHDLGRYHGVGQIELGFRRFCPHEWGGSGNTWGGYVCSSLCALRVRAWLMIANRLDICPYQHWAQGVHDAELPDTVAPATGRPLLTVEEQKRQPTTI